MIQNIKQNLFWSSVKTTVDNHQVIGNSPADLWLKTSQLLLEEGNTKLNYEILNLVMVLDELDKGDINYKIEEESFDNKFRFLFGDDRIDYAKTITFLEPKPIHFDDTIDGDYEYSSAIEGKWTKTYWSRMFNWEDNFNQIEQALKRIREGNNSKTISINVYHPTIDGKKTQAGIPCLLSLDIKPREDGLYFTAFYRSMRISKSGYADFMGLRELAEHISHRSGIVDYEKRRVNRITIMGSSVHLGNQNDELKNTKMMLMLKEDEQIWCNRQWIMMANDKWNWGLKN